ncbi:uncharacterized protein FN964_011848 isoform 1-T1 [Alca torda]
MPRAHPGRCPGGPGAAPEACAPAHRDVRPPSPPPVAMGTGAGAGHAGLKETAAVKCYESDEFWPISARGGGGDDQWVVVSTEGAGSRALGGDGGAGGSVKRTRRRSEVRVRLPLRPARSVPHRAGPAAPAKVAIMSDRKAVIKNADMSEEMQQDAVECATQALEKYNIEKDIAAHIKKEFDKKYNPTWHCIVGRNFGSYVTHETKHFIYFYLGQVAILLFKSG